MYFMETKKAYFNLRKFYNLKWIYSCIVSKIQMIENLVGVTEESSYSQVKFEGTHLLDIKC